MLLSHSRTTGCGFSGYLGKDGKCEHLEGDTPLLPFLPSRYGDKIKRWCKSSLYCHALVQQMAGVLMSPVEKMLWGKVSTKLCAALCVSRRVNRAVPPLTQHSAGGLSKYVRPCTTPPMKLPLLCKLMPISHGTLTFQSYYHCTAGRGLVPPCAKRVPRPTSGQAWHGCPIQ